jgi:hypothetical protein
MFAGDLAGAAEQVSRAAALGVGAREEPPATALQTVRDAVAVLWRVANGETDPAEAPELVP